MYKGILVPVDGSATSRKGLEEAIRLAKLTDGSVELVNVIDEMALAFGVDACAAHSQDVLAPMRARARDVLDQAQRRAAAAGVSAGAKVIETFSGPAGQRG